MQTDKRLPSPGLIVAMIALVAAMGGSALALPGRGDVETNDLKRRAVTTPKLDRQAVTGGKLARNAVKTAKIRDRAVTAAKLADGTVGADKVADGSLSTGKLSDITVIGLKPVNAHAGATEPTARNAAPPHQLARKGPLVVYSKCFTDTASDQTHAEVYIATASAGSVMWGDTDSLSGDPFLDPATPEPQRVLHDQVVSNNTANGSPTVFHAAAPDGTSIEGTVAAYAKNGVLADSQGIYGDGDVCLFAGNVLG